VGRPAIERLSVAGDRTRVCTAIRTDECAKRAHSRCAREASCRTTRERSFHSACVHESANQVDRRLTLSPAVGRQTRLWQDHDNPLP
jgi:hypothetical protein